MKHPTKQAARLAGVPLRTLMRWIAQRKVKAPKLTIVNGRAVRLWSKADVERIRKVRQKG